jgi:protocatechuate 3,4-dioxygenase beta subunit
MPYQAPSLTIRLTNPGTLSEASYFDVTVVGSPLPSPLFPAVGGLYDGWCLDSTLSTRLGTDLKAYLYSSVELELLKDGLPNLGTPDGSHLDQLDSINWLLGAYDGSTVTGSGQQVSATYGDVQAAIWKLLGEANYLSQPGTGPVDPTTVDRLADLALTYGDGYLPAAGQPLGVVLKPVRLVDGVEVALQPILIETRAAELGDFVWHDRDADGVQDTGEAGIAGATVELVRDLTGDGDFDDAGEVLATTATDGSGAYSFKGLTPGLDYQVRFAQPAGFDAASPRQADGSSNPGANSDGAVSDVVVLAPGENNRTLDAGFYRSAALGDRAWIDTNGNGQQDSGEAGLAGVKVELYACVANKPSGPVLATATTDADGNYSFSGLRPGDYIVKFITPTGWKQTVANVGADGTDSDARSGGLTGCYNLESGENDTTVDAGYYKVAKLGDRVWLDANANGRQDTGETGVAGVTVELYRCVNGAPAGPLLATKVTDANGLYLFTGLAPGDYMVKFVTPDGYTLTKANVGGDGADSDAGSGGLTGCYTLASGQTNKTVDAGLVELVKPASLGDRIWRDANANGQQDDGESGISGLNVTLVGGGADGRIDGIGDTIATTTTGDDGWYQFTGLTPGVQYQVAFSKPAGTVFTVQDSGSDAGDSDADVQTGRSQVVVLASGENNPTIDAGVFAPAALGDRVWFDCDLDGIQDASEQGVAGITVRLLGNNGDVVDTATTGSNGEYLFSQLLPGSYAVEFVAPTGYTFTRQDAGADGLDSDANPTTGRTITTTLDPGERDLTWDAGLRPVCRPITFTMEGSSTVCGTDGNARSFTDATTGVSVTARAFSQVKGADTWAPAFLGAYYGGLGVTDSSESGSGDTHTIDNVGRNNYVVLQFSQVVTVDKAFFGYVSGDSDAQIWIGNAAAPITSMNNAVLASMSFSEVNATTSTGTRWADVNADGVAGNVFIVAADTTDTTPEDYFKLEMLTVCAPDFCLPGSRAGIGNFVWEDKDADGVQDAGESGIAGVAVRLLSGSNAVLATTSTGSSGEYQFSNLAPGDYKIQVVAPSGFGVTTRDSAIATDTTDSDVDATGTTALTTLSAGEYDLSWDAGLVKLAKPGSKFYVVDPSCGSDDLLGYSASGTLNASTPLSTYNSDARGITGDAAGTKLWVLDADKGVYVYKADGTKLGAWTASDLGSFYSGSAPEGIALDGNDLWIVDRATKKLHWYDEAGSRVSGSNTAERTFSLASSITAPKGMTTDGTYLWLVDDASANSVFRYTITRDSAGTPTGLGGLVSWTLGSGITAPTGITIDPTGASQSLWVVDNATDSVYEFANARSRTSGSSVAASKSFGLGYASSNPQDIFDPLVQDPAAAGGVDSGSGGGPLARMSDQAFASLHDGLGTASQSPAGPITALPALGDLVGQDRSLDDLLGGRDVDPTAGASTWFAGSGADGASEVMSAIAALMRIDQAASIA